MHAPGCHCWGLDGATKLIEASQLLTLSYTHPHIWANSEPYLGQNICVEFAFITATTNTVLDL